MFNGKKTIKRFSRERAFNAHVGNHTSLYTKMQPLSFTPLLAEDLGINRAILLHQLQYWMNSMNSGKSIENVWNDPETHQQIVTYRKWIRDSIPEWHHILVYMSTRTIRRCVNDLIKHHLIMITSKINRNRYNHTHWYSINYEALNHMFVKKHPKLAKSMHIFPEVRHIKPSSGLHNNSSAAKSLYTINHQSNASNPRRYRCGQNVHIEQDKMSTSNRTKCPHRTGQNGRIDADKMDASISNSSTNKSTNSSRNSIKDSITRKKSVNKNLKNKIKSDNQKIKQKGLKQSSTKSLRRPQKQNMPQKRITDSGKSLKTNVRKPISGAMKMSLGTPTHTNDKHYINEMQIAYRNTWQDDMNPEHSMRIYKSMKHWVHRYGGSACVMTIRRVTGYIRREMYYGDVSHSSRWSHKLPTTSSRLRYLGRSIANTVAKDKQAQNARSGDHDYEFSNLPIKDRIKIFHARELKRQDDPHALAAEHRRVHKLMKNVKESRKRHMKDRYHDEKEFAKKFNGIK